MQTVLVPVNENEEQAQRVERTVLDHPFDREEIRLVVLNVFEEFEVESGEWAAISSEDFYDDEFPRVAASVASNLADAGFEVDVRREHGDPAKTIIDVAEELDAVAIVLAGRKRTPVGKVLFGSITQAVLLDSDVSVVVGPGPAKNKPTG